MPSSYTSSLRLTLPVQGELSGSWGNTVNTGITQLVDTSVAGTASITMTAADYTLTNNNGATDEARAMFLVLGGTPGNSFNVICPDVSKLYFVTNNSGFAQTVKTASGTGISVPNGASMVLRCDGTNVVEALNAFGSLTINTGKVVLPNTQSYAIRTNSGASCDVVTLTSGNVLQLGGGGATDSIQFWNQGLQRMALDVSGNLGIGTSSPGVKLDVNGGSIRTTSWVDITPSTATNNALYRSTNTGGTFYSGLDNSAGGVTGTGYAGAIWHTGAYPIGFGTSNALRMTLDSSGNLGLGVTPSAWSNFKAIQINTASNGAVAAPYLQLTSNAYFNGTNWIYTETGAATRFDTRPAGGAGFAWHIANSGTAGNAISFTQAMTLDASGNLAVGTSAAVSARIHAEGNGVTIRMKTTGAIGSGSTCFLQFDGSEGDSGYFGFGGTANVMDVWNRRNGAMTFGTNNTERARITSGGALLVGTTTQNVSTARYNCFNAPTGTNVAGSFKNAGGSSAQTIEAWNAATTGNNAFISLATEGTFTERGSISYNRAGGLVAYNTTSDYRAKDIIGPVQNPGATIDALKVYEGRMKGATQSRPMLIAHEAQVVAPYCVTGEKDAVNEDGAPVYQQMDVSSLVPLLLAELQSLRARVAALEAQP